MIKFYLNRRQKMNSFVRLAKRQFSSINTLDSVKRIGIVSNPVSLTKFGPETKLNLSLQTRSWNLEVSNSVGQFTFFPETAFNPIFRKNLIVGFDFFQWYRARTGLDFPIFPIDCDHSTFTKLEFLQSKFRFNCREGRRLRSDSGQWKIHGVMKNVPGTATIKIPELYQNLLKLIFDNRMGTDDRYHLTFQQEEALAEISLEIRDKAVLIHNIDLSKIEPQEVFVDKEQRLHVQYQSEFLQFIGRTELEIEQVLLADINLFRD